MSFDVKSKFYPIRDAWRENKCFAAGNTTTTFLCRCIIRQVKTSDSIMEVNESQMGRNILFCKQNFCLFCKFKRSKGFAWKTPRNDPFVKVLLF